MKFVKYALDYCNTRVGNEARNFIAKSVPRHIHHPSILRLQCLSVAAVSPGAARIDKNFSVAVVVREYMGMSENYKIRIREIKRQVSFVMDKIK